MLIVSQGGRERPDQVTLFKSVGLGAEDVAAAGATYDACLALGLGTEVGFGGQRPAE